MTLKQKFIKESLDIRYQVLEPAKFEQIADNYAIEFTNWVIDTNDKPVGQFTITELLEIFKKEKGL